MLDRTRLNELEMLWPPLKRRPRKTIENWRRRMFEREKRGCCYSKRTFSRSWPRSSAEFISLDSFYCRHLKFRKLFNQSRPSRRKDVQFAVRRIEREVEREKNVFAPFSHVSFTLDLGISHDIPKFGSFVEKSRDLFSFERK